MAFSAANFGSSGFGMGGASSDAQTQTGPDLELIETENLGFQAIVGEAKLRLLPSPWPSDALPPTTASLLSVASRKGILAAAGPDSVVVAGTESVRQAFSASDNAQSNIKSFTPQLALNIGTRISQVAFSADEEYLVLSSEHSGGLAVYEVQTIMQGQTTPAFQLSTNNTSLRALVPNPTPEKAELFALVTNNGELMIANLKTKAFTNGAQGQIMKNGVSSISWSTKGKQLVAGLGNTNGTCTQMTPEGQVKAEIPRPPSLEGDHYVASISWLENNVFLVGHNATNVDDPMTPPTIFHIVTRQTQERGPFLFQKLPEVCGPFGMERLPPHFFLQRLKDFPPSIQDIIVVASTASADVGIFSRAKAPLASGVAAESISNVFTTTSMANDSRRAQLPMSEDQTDTSPIGTAIDLSATEKVPRPLPGEEMDLSPGPVPAFMLLNNEGILSTWWIIYADSIRQGTSFPGLVSESKQSEIQSSAMLQPATTGGASTYPAPAFGQSNFGATSTGFGAAGIAKPSTSAFGSGNTEDQPSGSTFGMPSAPGNSWTSTGFANTKPQSGTSYFGQSSFGNTSTMGTSAPGPAFGATGGIGNRGSFWGSSPGAPQTGGGVFGQSGGLGMGSGSSFGAPSALGSGTTSGSTPAVSQGGFASFAKGGGFMTVASQAGGESPFAKANTASSPSSAMDTGSLFGGNPLKSGDKSGNSFSTSGFTLGSTFKPDGSASTDLPKPTTSMGAPMFGDAFGSALTGTRNEAPPAQSKEADMAEDDSDVDRSGSSEASLPTHEVRTPASRPSQPSAPISDTSTPKFGGLFGTQSQTTTTPAAVQNSAPAPSIFGNGLPPTTTPAETPRKQSGAPIDSLTPPSPQIKTEPEEQEKPLGVSKSIPEAPLPPESISKVSYAPGDSSGSSRSSAEDVPLPAGKPFQRTELDQEEKPPKEPTEVPPGGGSAPLPPDFLLPKKRSEAVEVQVEEESPLPPDEDDGGLDDEGSGVDVAQEISPTSDPNQSPRITPGSSFGASFGPSPLSNVFGKAQQPRQNVQTLFGEVEQSKMPHFPPPSRIQQSPRSPSPVRLAPPADALRPENARSISAPSRPQVTTANQRAGKPPTNTASTARPTAQEQRQKEREVFATQQARQQAEEQQDLGDQEDERVREELKTEVEATKTLDDFLAHQDYVSAVTKHGVPAQIETVYRDINSMVDTLGLNARALAGFVKGHSTLAKDDGRSLDDLDDNDWCLVEIEDLATLEDQLRNRLDQGRLKEVQEKLNVCRDLQKDLAKLRTRRTEVARVLDRAFHEESFTAIKASPLNAIQTSQQHEMRKRFTKAQKLIAEAEENITFLRASLASHDNGDGNTRSFRKPTVQAVTKTILKMTSMAEKKSGDIDVLEAQMRKLRFTPINQDSSREGSPFTDTFSSRISPVRKRLEGISPRATESPSSSFRRSKGDTDTPRRRMNEITAEEVSRYRTKMQRRKEVSQSMREAFAKTGPRIQKLE